ncbi:MAG: helix-turn-helix domain-containing protein [Anaerolineae bacterium]|jgi:transcriptional regulator with XRE-family HTH domain
MVDQEALALRNRIIGVLLRDARMQADKSKRECAAAVGVSPSTITSYEEGRKPLSLPELEVLAYFLDLPVTHFWNEEAQLLVEERLPPLERVLELRHRIIGVLLRQARLEADMSQKDLAQVLDCSSSRISAYEYGKRPIPLSELEALADALDLSMEHFLDERSGPVGEWQRQQEALGAFWELPEEIREFVTKPINRSYLELAMKLSKMPAGELRDVAEGLLEITY